MKKISSVRTSVKEDRVLAIIRVEGSDNPIFLSAKQIKSATGLSSNFSILKGSSISATFYKKGEKMFSGGECTEDGKIVREFEFELAEKTANIAAAAAFGASMF